MTSIQNKIVDAVVSENDDAFSELTRNLLYVKTRGFYGLIESNEVTVRGNDIFVGTNSVGSFETKDGKIEFTSSNDGAVHTFENDDELMKYVSGLTEDVTGVAAPQELSPKGKKDVKAPEGYDKHELASKHKDGRMENPKKKDHGHDDSSKDKEPKGSASGSNPPDKQHDLKGKHKDDRMENPKKNDHGHDDPSGDDEPSGSSSGTVKAHSHDPDGKGHGHDDPSGVGTVANKGK